MLFARVVPYLQFIITNSWIILLDVKSKIRRVNEKGNRCDNLETNYEPMLQEIKSKATSDKISSLINPKKFWKPRQPALFVNTPMPNLRGFAHTSMPRSLR